MTTPSQANPEIEQQTGERTHLAPRYHLILLDDDDHSYQYVIDLLGHVFGYGPEKSFAIACAVDSTGHAIMETAEYERVLKHQRQIHAFGRDPRIPRCKGSMSAVVEEAP